MMKFAFRAIALLILAACNRNTPTIVRFHIESEQLPEEVVLMTKDSIYTETPDAGRSVGFTLAGQFSPAYGAVFFNDSHLVLYIEPGKSFDISVKEEGSQIIPAFTGKGAGKNRYLNSEDLRYTPDFELNESEFIAALDKRAEELYKNLETMGFDDRFKQLERKRLKYTAYTPLMDYCYQHPYAAKDYQYRMTEDLYRKMTDIFSEDEDMLCMGVYQEYMKKMVSHITVRDLGDRFEDFLYILEELNYVTHRFKNPAVTEFMVNQIITSHIEREGLAKLPELLPYFESNVTDPKKKAGFNALCHKWRRIEPGRPSPSFCYKDIDGKEVKLSDFAGKYVYIDCWATWCGPCCREQPFLKKLEEKYAGKNIRFVSISCDQDKSAWEKAVREGKLEGIHLHSGNYDPFLEAYMIQTIPHFILIDREGKIINSSMTRPSDSETAKFIDALQGL